MSRIAAILLFTTLYLPLTAQTVWFSDDFGRSLRGIDWNPVTGNWHVRDGILQSIPKDYDDLLASSYYTYANQPYSIEINLRGLRAGIYFCLDSRSSKALSQMVRFDEKSLLVGYFSASGEFTATNTFDSPVMPSNWTALRIDIDPLKNTTKVFVNGALCGMDTNLVFQSGFIGLEASDGLCEFRSIRVFADKAPHPPDSPKKGSAAAFAHLAFVHPHGSVLEVYQPEFKMMVEIDSIGTILSASPQPDPPSMTKQTSLDGRTFLIDGKRILISDTSGVVVDSITERLVSPASLTSQSDMLYVADPGARVIFQFNSKGALQRSIDASVIGGLKAPRGVAIYQGKALVIADYDKLVLLEEDSSIVPTAVPGPDATTCRISWPAYVDGPAWLEVSADGGTWRRETNIETDGRLHRSVVVKNLVPMTRHSYRFGPALRTIPESFSNSKVFRFSTPPANPAKTSLTRLPILCMIYRTIIYSDKYPRDRFPQIPGGRTLSDADLQYLRQATQFNREFYFRNSGCKLVLDFDVYVVEDTLMLSEVGDSDPYWLSPNVRVVHDFEIAARAFGKQPTEYSGLICPYAWVNYPPRRTSALSDLSRRDTISIRQAVGGGTYGLPAPWKYGKTAGYTSNPFQDRFSRQDWLITHEFHHQIDALMESSGYPEYYHADQPWKMPGRFGEDFDFNSKIIRNADRTWWLNLKFGKLYETLDADHDGLPDEDATLPFDEKRLGSDPNSQDTDGDGVSDLDEVMMGSSRSSSLTSKDTDSDGLQDNVDPEPLYPISPTIPHIAAIQELELHPFGSIRDSSMNAMFLLAWTDSALCLSVRTDRPVNLLAQIDADNDGWFHGFDNFQIRVLNGGDSAQIADYYLRDCSSWVNSPEDRRDILKFANLGLSIEKLSPSPEMPYRQRLDLRIPRNDHYGLALNRGKKLSLRIGVQAQTDLWIWNELFERNYMMQVELR